MGVHLKEPPFEKPQQSQQKFHVKRGDFRGPKPDGLATLQHGCENDTDAMAYEDVGPQTMRDSKLGQHRTSSEVNLIQT